MPVLDRTYTLLGHEFDIDELKDIADHGMAMGVSGFIYYHENTAIFDEHDDEIQDYLSDWVHDNIGDGELVLVLCQGCRGHHPTQRQTSLGLR